MKKSALYLNLFALCLASFQAVRAQDATPAPATEVVAPAKVEPKEWTASAGFSAIINSGNAVNQTLGGNALVGRKWGKNQIGATALGAYGRAKDPTTGVTNTNTKNWRSALRYDRFLNETVSLFTLGHLGQDEPSGFEWRYGNSTGLSHVLVNTDPNFLKYEGGYDYTREQRTTAINANIHSGRFFFQYKYKFSAFALFGQDVESLFNLKEGKDIRINTLTSLTMKLTDKIAFQTGFGVRFDNRPVAGFKRTDTTTQAGLVLSFL